MIAANVLIIKVDYLKKILNVSYDKQQIQLNARCPYIWLTCQLFKTTSAIAAATFSTFLWVTAPKFILPELGNM